MAEFLLELLSEEIPARMQTRAADDLKRLIAARLKEAALPFEGIAAHATPRRLALVIDGLPKAQPDSVEERRGPRVDAPQAAIDGFLGATGLTLEACERRETEKGAFYFARIERKGRPTAEVLAELLPDVFQQFPWPKSMRWGAGRARWVRPLHGLLCLFDGNIVPVAFDGIAATDRTTGHRFLAPKPFKVKNFNDYRERLRAAYVMLEKEKRIEAITADATLAAKSEDLRLAEAGGLLEEVAGLVEWPVVLIGDIDPKFMGLPPEVLTTVMRAHQKYFALLDGEGKLAPRFVLVSNMQTTDGGRAIIAGNERVLRARLEDAQFFWDQDRKHKLVDWFPGLHEVVFHARLGSLAERAFRLQELADYVATAMGAKAETARRAAQLAKCDLLSGMVHEFPELQGVMGRYYAIESGEPEDVATAIAEHYSPQGPNDTCPSAPASVALALSDKIDQLVGFFAIGEKPTGSKDPFALRRAALGVIRLILENRLRLALRPLFQKALALQSNIGTPDAGLTDELLDFFADRLKVHLKEQGIRHDHISAVFALTGEDDFVRLLERVAALREFLESEDGANLLIAYRRARNIVHIEEKNDATTYDGAVSPTALREDQEQALHARLEEVQKLADTALKNEEFTLAMSALARLRVPVDAFFDHVTVNAEDKDLRKNRLHLLANIRRTLESVADFFEDRRMKFKKAKAQWVYGFGGGHADGNAGLKDLLGGKGANLAEMSNLGLPVPPGFTISTEVCTYYYANDRTYPDTLKREVQKALSRVEKVAGAKFGHRKKPLLLSVRSGARASMPGMMDTVLNIGLNDENVERLGELSNDRRFAWDSYRRFLQMYGDVVLGVPHYLFEDILELYKADHGLHLDTDLGADDWQTVAQSFKERIEKERGAPFPQDPEEQLWGAIGAVFSSWMNQRAITYRRLHGIPEDWGTAVNVQAMVFGNMGEDCATGVAFTRNPATGEKDFYGEFLPNAQGEDVVAGIRTPQPMTERARQQAGSDLPSLETTMPEVYAELDDIRARLESHFRDMQDIEFTVQRKKLWVLQTRNGKRTMSAALKIAVDMTQEGLITHEEAIRRVDPAALDQLLHPTLDPNAEQTVLATGLPASPGAAVGRIVFTAAEAETEAARGATVILVRVETSPEDIHGMHAAAGILTTRGGLTSHAAVVARGMGRPCVSGAGDIRINEEAGEMRIGDRTLKRGDVITIDGAKGHVLLGEVPMRQPELSGDFAIVMDWADRVRRLGVRANAETPQDAEVARRFGAEGIGLCRTEHMFFEAERILAVREMILAEDAEARRAALAKLLPMQRQDFIEIFRVMAGFPVTIRLLDPPLHEFLPKTNAEMKELAAELGIDAAEVKARAERLHETNPMLGHRGCRLGITYPEIYEMQARAIFEAVLRLAEETGETVVPEIMIPLVTSREEFDFLKTVIDRVAGEIAAENGEELTYRVGTMIELPRAALRAGEIAKSAEFFSFGTNDLTQTTFGISRDDATGFLKTYLEKKLIEKDPFSTLDIAGVGELVKIAAERGRAARGDLHLGICGEHGGDPASIAFCEKVGLDYVSCSPYRVPIARLAAAHAALKD